MTILLRAVLCLLLLIGFEGSFAEKKRIKRSSTPKQHATLPCPPATPIRCGLLAGSCCPRVPNSATSCCGRTRDGCKCPDGSCPNDGKCCPSRSVRCRGKNGFSYCCPRRLKGPDAANCCPEVNGCLCRGTNKCPINEDGLCCPRGQVGCQGTRFDFCCEPNLETGVVCCKNENGCLCDNNLCPVGETGFCCSRESPVLCTFFLGGGATKLACCPLALVGADRTNVCCSRTCAVIAGVCFESPFGKDGPKVRENTHPRVVSNDVPQLPLDLPDMHSLNMTQAQDKHAP